MQSTYIKNFLADEKKIDDLFFAIVSFSRPSIRRDKDLRGWNCKLFVEEILLFFTKDNSKFLTNNFVCNSLVIIAAFEFAWHKKRRTPKSTLTRKQFHNFMEAMFLFSHLWEMYLVSDDNVQDEILFIGEFLRARHKLPKVKGVQFNTDVSEEEWTRAFKDIDKSSDEEISFGEVCRYVTKRIISPKKYTALAISDSEKTEHTESNRRGMRAFSTRKEQTKKVIELMDQLSFRVDGSMFAVDMPTLSSPSCRPADVLERQCTLDSLRHMIDHSAEDSCAVGDDTSCTGMSVVRLIQQKRQQPALMGDSRSRSQAGSPTTNMDFYTAANALKAANDFQNTRARLALRSKVFSSARAMPDSPPGGGDSTLRGPQEERVRRSVAQDLDKASVNKQNSFSAKFPDVSRMNPRPYPHSQIRLEDDDPDLKFLFVTENLKELNRDASSVAQSCDADSNYIPLDRCNLSHYSGGSEQEAQLHSSLSIRVQSDVGGSIHTHSMQQLSFDRDTGRRPVHIGGGDVSIALSSVLNDGANDDMTLNDCSVASGADGCPQTEENVQPQSQNVSLAHSATVTNSFGPLDSYAARPATPSTAALASTTLGHSRTTFQSQPHLHTPQPHVVAPFARKSCALPGPFYRSRVSPPRAQLRPGSAPARTANISLGLPEGGREWAARELELKYYPPKEELGYYVQRAKSSSRSRQTTGAPRGAQNYRVLTGQRGGRVPASQPLCHSWMKDEVAGFVHGRTVRDSRVPMNTKKARAVESLRRAQLASGVKPSGGAMLKKTR